MTPRFVYFDLDDTLLDHRAAERAALADCHRQWAEALGGVDLGTLQDVYHRENVPLWRDYGRGQITRDDLKRLRFANTFAALGCDTLDADEASTTYLDRYGQHWTWSDGAEAVFRAVADRFPVGVLTNGFRDQQLGKLARFPEIADRSETVVISEDVGVMKPHPEIFAHATRVAAEALAAPLDAADVLYVGDSFHSDVEGGTAAGWHVAWIRGDDARAPERTTVLPDWRALLELLGLG